VTSEEKKQVLKVLKRSAAAAALMGSVGGIAEEELNREVTVEESADLTRMYITYTEKVLKEGEV